MDLWSNSQALTPPKNPPQAFPKHDQAFLHNSHIRGLAHINDFSEIDTYQVFGRAPDIIQGAVCNLMRTL